MKVQETAQRQGAATSGLAGARRSPLVLLVPLTGVVVILLALLVEPPEHEMPAPIERGAGDYMIITNERLQSLPVEGEAWEAMREIAELDPRVPDLGDQNNQNAPRILASALIYARTGEASYRDLVSEHLRAIQSSSLSNAQTLSVGRQLAGYVIAADLISYRDPEFIAFVAELRTREFGGHDRWNTLVTTSEITANNWGAWALASRIATSRYVGDHADVARAAQVFRGFLGERAAHAGFLKTAAFDPMWACDADQWVPINPANCGDRSGAIVDDISRSDGTYPRITQDGYDYSWETLSASVLSATLLARAGYPDVWEWEEKALLRAAQFLYRHGGYVDLHRINQHSALVINHIYGTDFGPLAAAGFGRQYGYTDWLLQ